MAEKYKLWDKKMLTFTIPSHIMGKTIKKGRYTKLKYLLELRAYIAKQFNNIKSDMKYFITIELGTAYSNPHLHIQTWSKSESNSDTSSRLDLIKQKAITKFNLDHKRCHTTIPTHDHYVYHYVVKDFSKHLTDKQVMNIETQKKRMSKQIGQDSLRWWSKSGDKYTKKLYRFSYNFFGVLRKYANEFIDNCLSKLIMMFSVKTPQLKALSFSLSKLYLYKEQEIVIVFFYFLLIIFNVIPSCRGPPLLFYSIFS